MPRLRVMSGAQVRALLEAHGFVFVRQKGSHMILQKRTAEGTRSATVPEHKEVARGTLASIIEQSGLDRSLFEV